ncbi:MAG: hypothetical protein HKN60_01900 [Rhizobiales bacterium]|nr:hypothetical protein [Hyphomicrobiales bacterium]
MALAKCAQPLSRMSGDLGGQDFSFLGLVINHGHCGRFCRPVLRLRSATCRLPHQSEFSDFWAAVPFRSSKNADYVCFQKLALGSGSEKCPANAGVWPMIGMFRSGSYVKSQCAGNRMGTLPAPQFRQISGVDIMLKLKTIGLVAAAALALTVAQPKPAEAGNAGKVIAGIALGAIALGALSHAHRAHAYPHAYYAPEVYYQPHGYYHPRPRAYYHDRDYRYYGQHAPRYRYHKKHVKKGPSRWLQSHPSAARYR